MSIITFPTSLAVARQSWGQQRNDFEFRSMFGVQSIEASSPLWAVSMTPPADLPSITGAWQGLMLSLRGRQNQLAVWNMGRPVPLGTLRGSITMAVDNPAGTSIMYVSSPGQPFATVKSGDYFGVGSGSTQQVVMAIQDAVADSSGKVHIVIEPPLRYMQTAGSPVTWNMPCALFRRKSSNAQWDQEPFLTSGMTLDLIEDTRP